MIAPTHPIDEPNHDAMQRYRRAVLIAFDVLLWQRAMLHHRRGGIRRALELGFLTVELEAEIVRLFRAGATHQQIRERVPVGPTLLNFLSRKHRAAEWKKGHGRRIAPATKKEIVRAIHRMMRGGTETNRSIAREFGCSEYYVQDLRRALGDREDRRFRRKLNAQDVTRATRMLREGHTWRSVAQAFHVALWTLQKVCPLKGRA